LLRHDEEPADIEEDEEDEDADNKDNERKNSVKSSFLVA
jgi:hypothetical protein